MLKTFFTIVILLIGFSSFSQSIEGKWTGVLKQEIGGMRTSYTFNMNLKVDNIGNITGFSEISFNDTTGVYGIITLKGFFDGKYLHFEEQKVTEQQHGKNMYWCIKSGNLKYKEKGGMCYLSGKWEGKEESCQPGTIYLSKKNPKKKTITERKEKEGKIVNVDSDLLYIEIYDYGKQDGDIISLFLNDKPVLTKHLLTHKHHKFKLKLDKNLKKNKLVLFAHNLGDEPPNTAEIIIKDGGFVKIIRLSSNLNESDIIYLKYAK